MNPVISIIIPTKNRYEYIREVLQIICNIRNENIEIVVQDNSDEGILHDSFLHFVAELNDNRVKYFYYNGPLSINQNSDRAVINSNGKYVTFIGDDDCVTSAIAKVAVWMEKESVEVVTFHCPAYIWPDVEFKYLGKKHTGVLTYEPPTGKVEFKNPSIELSRLLKKGGQYLTDMPQLYHGIASREVLNKIYMATGSFFPGSVPDMDVAVCLSLYSAKYCKIDVPVVISGTARKSAGGLGAAKLHKGDIRKIPTLPVDTADTWDPFNPFFWSGPTIYADSIYKCLTRTGNSAMLSQFNYNYLYAMLLIFNNDYFAEIRRTIKVNKKASYTKIFYYASLLFLFRLKIFIKNRLPLIFPVRSLQFKFPGISEAVDHLEKVTDGMILPWNNSVK
jgi:glycosyltransferase involved in cell wall biosynthesis